MHPLTSRFEAYLRDVRHLAESTISRYVGVVSRFENYLLVERVGLVPPAATRLDVEAFLVDGSGDAPTTWNLTLAALVALYGLLQRERLVSSDPTADIDRRRVPGHERVPLSLDEMLRLVDAIERHAPSRVRDRNLAIVQVLLHCALRVSEVVALRRQQVDLENRVFLDVPLKGGKKVAVYFNDVVASAIARHLCQADSDQADLFLSWQGERLGVRSVQNMVAAYAQRAGISRRVTPHVLRHSSATHHASLGTSVSVVKELCGHASIRTTQRYIHASASARRTAVETFGNDWRKHLENRRSAKD